MLTLYAMLCCYQWETCPFLDVNPEVDGRAKKGKERECEERIKWKLQLGCKINLINNERMIIKRQIGYNLL